MIAAILNQAIALKHGISAIAGKRFGIQGRGSRRVGKVLGRQAYHVALPV